MYMCVRLLYLCMCHSVCVFMYVDRIPLSIVCVSLYKCLCVYVLCPSFVFVYVSFGMCIFVFVYVGMCLCVCG